MTSDGATLGALFEERFGVAPAAPGTQVDPALARLIGRRICRRYQPEPLADALMETLLAAAQSAPAKSDLQQYAIILTDEPARREIGGLIRDDWISDAPHLLVFCADLRRGRRITAMKGRTYDNNNLDSFMNASVDAGLALMMFCVAADAAGVGTCPISMVRNHIERVTELLALPEGVFPVAGLTVGRPAATRAVAMRLPPAIVVHRGRYDDSKLEAELAAYDARRHERQPLPAASQKNAAVYGKSDVVHWSDNVARQLSLPERAQFAAFLKSRGIDVG
jgi:nitroreductase/FMN reductase [NAD(P)H]